MLFSLNKPIRRYFSSSKRGYTNKKACAMQAFKVNTFSY
ncbi:hypothetical protein PARC_a2905 [Pseudoalteromonas arctica A 37-1-2]|uniref:Uncharacterized protein n=1 Tax=Pseudoalteromonas arctica A 37-1-2 TaxID=1117313 RepID=A0A290S5A8_9GAMM|nr:hypothetical protein PARC_a2905 [Pseudoalteromonas arctica A 37-1-2]